MVGAVSAASRITRRGALAGLGAVCAAGAARAAQTWRDRLTITRAPYPAGVARAPAEAVFTERDVGGETVEFAFAGATRRAHLYLPGGASRTPRAAVTLLHGAGRSGLSMIPMWKETAERRNLLLVAPDSRGRGWSAAEDAPQLLAAALNEARARTALDPARLFLFGHSSGGELALHYANRLGGVWRAAATHGASIDPRSVEPARPAPPLRMYLGVSDQYFRVSQAESAAAALAKAGHPTELVEIRGHDHWYYEIGPHLSAETAAFFEAAG